MTVVLLDEMDLMVTRKQTVCPPPTKEPWQKGNVALKSPCYYTQVLYNLFDWPMRAGSNLAVIGVANTMDLPERLLPRIASRLGQRRVQFMPYNKQQIMEIIQSRLKDIPAFADPKVRRKGLSRPTVAQGRHRHVRECRNIPGLPLASTRRRETCQLSTSTR